MTVTEPVPDRFEERVHCVLHADLEAHANGEVKVCAECERRIDEMLGST